PTTLSNWAGTGELIFANFIDSTAPVSDAYLDNGIVMEDPVVVMVHFVLTDDISADNPALVIASKLVAADKSANELSLSTNNLLIQSSP
ncbi:MAG: hypothetical protein HUU55_18345, partial [Myxococcales bacterium]|nr:hypothetical protein [Myxococcales bacterium]